MTADIRRVTICSIRSTHCTMTGGNTRHPRQDEVHGDVSSLIDFLSVVIVSVGRFWRFWREGTELGPHAPLSHVFTPKRGNTQACRANQMKRIPTGIRNSKILVPLSVVTGVICPDLGHLVCGGKSRGRQRTSTSTLATKLIMNVRRSSSCFASCVRPMASVARALT